MPQSDAQQLAYYSTSPRKGVLAPRGWYCFGVYGSGGSAIFVVPEPIDTANIFNPDRRGFAGPAVEISSSDGGTSGRFNVAEIIGRVFPAYKAFATRVAEEFMLEPDRYQFGPYPEDKLIYKGDALVEYGTPAQANGLGTRSWLKQNDSPIAGVAILDWETTDHNEMPNVVQLSVRLPRNLTRLTPAIIHQVELDVANHAGH